MKNRPWTTKDIKKLEELLSAGAPNTVISKELDRTTDSIAWKLKNLGLKRKSMLKGASTGTAQAGVSMMEALENKSELVRVFRENIFAIPIKVEKQITKGREEKAVLFLSDMHTGMVNTSYFPGKGQVITYDEAIRQTEMTNLRDSVFQIHDLLTPSYNIKELYLVIAGDMITNDRIFEGQAFEIDRPYGKQMWDTTRDLAFFIRELQKKFEQINVIGVVGNHGRSHDQYQEEPVENNYEWTMYKILEQTFIGVKGVKVTVPDSRFYSFNIYKHSYYMSHGDNIRGASSSAIEKAGKDLLVAILSDIPEGFDIYMMGHFHRSEKRDINEKSTMLLNGSWIPRDSYGFRLFKQYSKPTQWFFGVNEKRAMTWNFALDLRS